MSYFLSRSSERWLKIPLPWYESVLTGSGTLEGIWITSGSIDSESCYWKWNPSHLGCHSRNQNGNVWSHGSIAVPRFKFSNGPTQPKNLSQCGGRAHLPTIRRHTSHRSFCFFVFTPIWMKVWILCDGWSGVAEVPLKLGRSNCGPELR